MSYFTERHGMREAIKKTQNISHDMYVLLFQCCERYYNNIAWKYPDMCPDGHGCCGLNQDLFEANLKYDIPSLFRNNYGKIAVPSLHHELFSREPRCDEFDQYALLDYIEFFAQNCKDIEEGSFHSYFGHRHIKCKESDLVFKQFQDEINGIFIKTGLLYCLTDEKIIERVVDESPLTGVIEERIKSIKEDTTRELLTEAILIFRKPYPDSFRDATEKIWDAFERLKTYYTNLDKKGSSEKVVNDIAGGEGDFKDLFEKEFKELTIIGNHFRIRHHETNCIDINDQRHYEYFFNRCLSLIALAIQYLE